MPNRQFAAIAFAVVAGVVVLFQLALALGAPLGAYAMGGAFPGQFPPAMRVAALIQVLILLVITAVVLSRGGVLFPRAAHAARRLIWIVVAFSAVGLVLNLITPSAVERITWAPVAFVLLVTSLLVATGPQPPNVVE